MFRTLNATLDEASLAGTRFPVSLSYDAGQVARVLGQTLVNMSKSVEMGIAVSSHDAAQLNTAVIDHVRAGTGALFGGDVTARTAHKSHRPVLL